ncbi:hypothetical protein AAK938_09155 [Aerococcaceae bacterium 50-4]
MFKKLDAYNKKFEQIHEEMFSWYWVKLVIVFWVFFNWIYGVDLGNNLLELALKIFLFIIVNALFGRPREDQQPRNKRNIFVSAYFWINAKINQLNTRLYQWHNLKYILVMVIAIYYTTTRKPAVHPLVDVIINSFILILITMLFLKPHNGQKYKK